MAIRREALGHKFTAAKRLAGAKRRAVAKEAGLERGFAKEQATTRFGRARQLISGLTAEFGPSGNGADDRAGLEEIESSIRASGKRAQGQASGAAARRGIFTGGASLATEARIQGETEASVAGKRGEIRESAANRRARKKAQRLQSVTQISSEIARGAFL